MSELQEEFAYGILAALLHDIGKISHRIGVKDGRNHEERGSAILNQSRNIFSKVRRHYFEKEEKISVEEARVKELVKLADWIASGEREEREKGEEKVEKLINKFSTICTDKKEFLRLMKFSSVLKNNYLNQDEEKFWEYREQLNELSERLEELNITKIDNNLIQLIEDFLREYSYYTTSAFYHNKPTIDLFTHSKITAAIFSILYYIDKKDGDYINKLKRVIWDLFEERKNQKEKKESLSDKKITDFIKNHKFKEEITKQTFIIIKGDFSGIQDFISTVYTKDALKMFKARSSYLSLLNKLIPNQIIEIFGLTDPNIIFTGGGNFEIISYYDEEKIEELEGFIKDVNSGLYEKFQGKLFLSVSYKKVAPIILQKELFRYLNKNESERIDPEIKEIVKKLRSKEIQISDKHKKNYEIIKKKIEEKSGIIDDGLIETEKVEGEITKECPICHKIFKTDKKKEYCKECSEFLNLRNFLRDLEISKNNVRYQGEDKVLFKFGEINLFKFIESKIKFYSNFRKLKFIKSLDFYQYILGLSSIGYPLNNDHQIIDFNKLVEKNKESKEKSQTLAFIEAKREQEGERIKLAALKIDVDNLGKLVTQKLCEESDKKNREYIKSLSDQERISYDLRVFFEGIIDQKIFKKYKQSVYIIFSGGDDTFVVGRWMDVLNFARELYNEFKIFVSNNEKITISAAYYRFDVGYPVSQVYKKCEEMLEKAKDEGKNKINVENLLLKWDRTEEEVFSEEFNIEKIINQIKKLKENLEEYNNINQFKIFLQLSNLFYWLSLESKDKKSILSKSTLERFLTINEEIFSRLNTGLKLKVHLFKYALSRNLNTPKDRKNELESNLWELLKEYYFLLMIGKIKQDLLGYSIKYALWYKKDREVKK